MEQIEAEEKDRSFCRHDIGHFLDVARLSLILQQERGTKIPQEILYAAALLHDIGRHLQYREGKPHELASAEIALNILKECEFTDSETDVIIQAIREHRASDHAGGSHLCGLIYDADKLSRPCYFCKAEKDCNWKAEKKNNKLQY